MGANNFVAMPSIPAGLSQPAESAPVDLYAVVPPNGFATAGISVILGGSFEGAVAILGSLDGVNYRPVTQGFIAGKLTDPSKPSFVEFPPQLITDLIRYIKWKVLPNTRVFSEISITLGGSLNCDCASGGGGSSNQLIETFTAYEDFPAFSPVVVRALDGKIGLGGGLSQDIQAYFVGVAIDAAVGVDAQVRVCLAGVCTVNMTPLVLDEPSPAPGMALWALGGGYASLGNSQETGFLAEYPRPYARYLGTIIDVSNYGTNNTVEAVIIPNNPADAYVGITLRVPPLSAAKIVRMFGANVVFASAQSAGGIVGVIGVVADFQVQSSVIAQYAEVGIAGAVQVQWDGQGALTPGAPVYVSADPLLPGAATMTAPVHAFQIGILIDGYSAVPQGPILVALQIGSGAGGGGSDELVKVSFADTTPSYLGIKLQAGPRVALSVLNPGGNEALEVTASDTRVAVTGTDTSPAFLGFKVAAGANVSLSILNPGGNEIVEISSVLDNKVKVTNADTTPGFLAGKLQAGTGITLNTLNPGANEKLEIVSSAIDEKVKATVNDTTPDYLQNKLVAGSNVTISLLNPGGNEQLSVSASGGGGGGGFEYNLDFSAQPNSGPYADGPVTIDGRTWTVFNVANSQQFEIVNGTGLIVSPTGGDFFNFTRSAPAISVPFVNVDADLSFGKYSDIRFECLFDSQDDEPYEGLRTYFENGSNAGIGGYTNWGLARQTEPAGRALYLVLTNSGVSTFDTTNIGATINHDVYMLRFRGVDNVELWTAQSSGGNFPSLSAYRFQGRINQPGISSGIKKNYETNDPSQLLYTLVGISVAAPNNYYPIFKKLRVSAV